MVSKKRPRVDEREACGREMTRDSLTRSTDALFALAEHDLPGEEGRRSIMFTVSRISETSNAVSLSTVSPVEPAVVDGGLAPGPTIFATMLMFVSVGSCVHTPLGSGEGVGGDPSSHLQQSSQSEPAHMSFRYNPDPHQMIHTDIQQRSTFFCSAGDPSQHPLAAPPHRVARRLALLGQRAGHRCGRRAEQSRHSDHARGHSEDQAEVGAVLPASLSPQQNVPAVGFD